MRNVFRLRQLFNLLGLKQPCCAIRVVGTNAKGSTGRYLALMSAMSQHSIFGGFDNAFSNHIVSAQPASFAKEASKFGWEQYECAEFKQLMREYKDQALSTSSSQPGLKVLHFSSPHLLSVYERFWANYLDDEQIKLRIDLSLGWLKERLAKLDLRNIGPLGFFELTCLLLPLAFYDANLWVIEAGLGAFYDSSEIFSYLFHILTPISFDHINFYNNTDEIIEDKTHVKGLIISACEYEYFEHLRRLGKPIITLNKQPNSDYLEHNFALAKLAYLQLFNQPFNQIRPKLDLLGRRHIYKGALIDVAHNEAGAKALANCIKHPVHFVCAFKQDKANAQIIDALKPLALSFSALNDSAKAALNAANIASKYEKDRLKEAILNNPSEFVICGSFDAARWAYSTL